jgi:hypothetical protein
LFTTNPFGPAAKTGTWPACNARMGSEPSNQRLGRLSGPTPQPAWAVSGPWWPPAIRCHRSGDRRSASIPPDPGRYISSESLEKPQVLPHFFLPPAAQAQQRRLCLPHGRRDCRRR